MTVPERRSISDIKVDHTPVGMSPHARLTIEFTDGAGERVTIERYSLAAKIIITDLHASTLVGEGDRRGYLLGFIRCHQLRRGLVTPEDIRREER